MVVFVSFGIVAYTIYAFASAEFMFSKTRFSYIITFKSVMVWLVLIMVCGAYTMVDLFVKTFRLRIWPTCYSYF